VLVPTLADALPRSAPQWAATDGSASRRPITLAPHSAAAGRDVAWLARLISKLCMLLCEFSSAAAEPLATPARPGLPLQHDARGSSPSVTRDVHAAVGLEEWRMAELGYESLEQLLVAPLVARAFTWAERAGRRCGAVCGWVGGGAVTWGCV